MLLGLDRLWGMLIASGRWSYVTASRCLVGVVGAAVFGFLLYAFGMLTYSFLGAFGLLAELVLNVFLPGRWELDGLLRVGFPIGFGLLWAFGVITESEFLRSVRTHGWRQAISEVGERASETLEPWRNAAARASLDRVSASAVNRAGRTVRREDMKRLETERKEYEYEAREASRRAASLSGHVRPRVDLPEQFGIEPFLGWRGWRVRIEEQTGDLFLHAVGVDYQWPGRQVRAECGGWRGSPQAHRSPDPNCTCGIYAVKEREWLGYSPAGIWAQGWVRLWGKVVETEKGYRAGIARIEGPVELILGCEYGEDGWCTRPVKVAVVYSVGFDLCCDAHRPVGGLRDVRPIDEFIGWAADQLQHRYEVPFVVKGA